MKAIHCFSAAERIVAEVWQE